VTNGRADRQDCISTSRVSVLKRHKKSERWGRSPSGSRLWATPTKVKPNNSWFIMIDYNSAAHCPTGRSIAANLFRQQRIPYVVHSHRAYTSTVNPMYCVDLGLHLYAEIRTEFVSNVDQSQTRCQLSVIILRHFCLHLAILLRLYI